MMNPRKILNGLVAVIMAAAIVVLVTLIVNRFQLGIETTNHKLVLCGYGLMIVYAGYRLYKNIRDLFSK